MKKRRIVIASVLKPVDDTRMWEKMAASLAGTGVYEIWIIGQPSKSVSSHPDIHFVPLKSFSRISISRLLAPAKVQQILHQVKPDILIVNTHELLIVGVLNRIFFGVRLVYDVRENYYRNIRHSEAFPPLLRPFLATWVRLKEKALAPLVHRFLLAEKGYEKEMHFFAGRAVIVENKVQLTAPPERVQDPGKIRLLFSGTLAESTGVFSAIRLAERLHAYNPSVQLTIIGYAAKAGTREKIRSAVSGKEFIRLVGIDHLVPHKDILSAIAASDFGVICYPPSPHTENSIPTKLYEYLACRLPILMMPKSEWESLCSAPAASIAFDFTDFSPAEVFIRMQSPFYLRDPEDVTWDSEAPRFLAALESI